METVVRDSSSRSEAPTAGESVICRPGRPTAWANLVWMYRNSRALHPDRGIPSLFGRAALLIRQLAYRSELQLWQQPGNAPLLEMLACRPALVTVVHRPYLSIGWDGTRRLAAIDEHYRQIAGRGRSLRLASEPEAMQRLATVTGRESTVEIVLDSPSWFIHEGELCLNLFQGGDRLYTLAFSLGFDRGEPVAFVGALQGLGSDRALDRYRTLTHDLHGLRPRDLLIAAFRKLCQELGLARWLAVSDGDRVSRSDYFQATQRLHSSYDEAWSSHGGTLRPDGFHDMPLRLARRSTSQIPSRKRSSYRQRYEMLDRLEAEMADTLGRLGEA